MNHYGSLLDKYCWNCQTWSISMVLFESGGMTRGWTINYEKDRRHMKTTFKYVAVKSQYYWTQKTHWYFVVLHINKIGVPRKKKKQPFRCDIPSGGHCFTSRKVSLWHNVAGVPSGANPASQADGPGFNRALECASCGIKDGNGNSKFHINIDMGMDQYLLIPFLGGYSHP
jgi:hypothetical protein